MERAGLIIALITVVVLFVLPAPKTPQADAPRDVEAGLLAPDALRDWILSGQGDYLLIDLRPEDAFLDDAIKTAVSMPASSLDDATIRSLPASRRLVVYADSTGDAVETWQRIIAHRERTYVLDGGLKAWKAQVLHPHEPAPDASQAAWNAYQQDLAVARYFLGKTDAAPVERGRVVAPVLRPRPTLRSEGC